jgi:hypothetical protein
MLPSSAIWVLKPQKNWLVMPPGFWTTWIGAVLVTGESGLRVSAMGGAWSRATPALIVNWRLIGCPIGAVLQAEPKGANCWRVTV